MDKETLSNYGWIVICVLVLAVMLALATPFGTFVADAVKSTTAGLFGANQNALGAAGIVIDDQAFQDTDGAGNPGGSGDAGDQGVIDSLPAVGKTAEEYTWEEIKAISEAGKADEYFNLGDTKTITVTGYGDVVMEIVAFNADLKSDSTGTAGISWVSKKVFASHAMNAINSNANGWATSEMRSWLQSDVYNALPAEVKNSIVAVNKTYYDKTTNSTKSISDTVWIPSQREIFNDGSAYCEDSGVDYTSYFTDAVARTKYRTNGSHAPWWLRSASSSLDSHFRDVNASGASYDYYAADYSFGVVLGFCT